MGNLGEVLRELMDRRKITGVQLASEIGISATSVSKILNGVTKPRQTTFTRLCQYLCQSEDDKNRLVNAFAVTDDIVRDVDLPPYGSSAKANAQRDSDKEINRLRAEQFIERKSQSIQFKRSVARELDKAGIPYIRDYCEGIISTDFLINPNGKRIALECKANVGRDMERTEAMCEVIGESLGCRVVIVVPYLDKETECVKTVALADVRSFLK